MVQRSHNSHQLALKARPFFARLRREEPFRSADDREWRDAADRIAGPIGWYARAGRFDDAGCRLIHFATPLEADEMQRWIAESGIETRPAPPKYDGTMLSVGGQAARPVREETKKAPHRPKPVGRCSPRRKRLRRGPGAG